MERCCACEAVNKPACPAGCRWRNIFPTARRQDYERLKQLGGLSTVKKRCRNLPPEQWEDVITALLWSVDQWVLHPRTGPYQLHLDALGANQADAGNGALDLSAPPESPATKLEVEVNNLKATTQKIEDILNELKLENAGIA